MRFLSHDASEQAARRAAQPPGDPPGRTGREEGLTPPQSRFGGKPYLQPKVGSSPSPDRNTDEAVVGMTRDVNGKLSCSVPVVIPAFFQLVCFLLLVVPELAAEVLGRKSAELAFS